MNIRQWLLRIDRLCAASGDPDLPFYYLGGCMTGVPQFNFPEFQRVANILRMQGYNIVSPAELDDPDDEAAALASPDGAPGSGSTNGKTWSDFLARDVVICAMPTCVGAILLPGWERSRGATLETYVLDALGKPLFEFEDPCTLIKIDREGALTCA